MKADIKSSVEKLKKKLTASIRRRILTVLLSCGLLAVFLTGAAAFKSISDIRQTALLTGNEIIMQAARDSEEALTERAKTALKQTAADKAGRVDDNLSEIRSSVQILADMMTRITSNPEQYGEREIAEPNAADAGEVKAQLLFSSAAAREGYDDGLRREIGRAANIKDFLEQTNENSDVIVSSYIASEKGYTIMADRFSDRKFKNAGADGAADFYDAQSRPWYNLAKSEGRAVFTGVVLDALGGGPCIICAAPYYDNGKFAGVVGMGAFLDDINNIMLSAKVSDAGFGFIVSKNGGIVVSPRRTGELAPDADAENPRDLRLSGNPSLARAIEEMTKEDSGAAEAVIDGEEYYLAHAPMKNTDWYFATAVEADTVIAPAKENYDYIVKAAKERIDELDGRIGAALFGMGAAVAALLALTVYIGRRLADYLTRPVRQLSDGVQKIASGNLDAELDIHTGDEIESLAVSFNAMAAELKAYMKNLEKITAEKQRIATELNVATAIQKNMLPCIFPPYPDREEFDIYAVMYPAKEVGGDFYDFYLLDENHLVVTIADVSDKGIPAAMFMVVAKTVLKNFAMSMTGPDDFAALMQCANRQLCENNEEMMFVTVFMGMLDLKSGRFIYVNAGHTPPLLCRRSEKGRDFKRVPVEKNCVLGIREKAVFKQQELTMQQGDELFLYTDGVTEAGDRQGRIFTIERLIETLNGSESGLSCRGRLAAVKKAVEDFVQDAPQSDDITMLAVKLRNTDESEPIMNQQKIDK